MSKTLSTVLDERLSGARPSSIVFGTAGAVVAGVTVYRILAPGDLVPRAYRFGWAQIRRVAAHIVDKEIDKAASGITFPHAAGERFTNSLPDAGLSEEEVVHLSNTLHDTLDQKMDKSLLSGVVYWGTHNFHSTLMKILDTHLWANPLFADYFGATRKMEAEIVNMCLKLFNGPPGGCGTYTMGGSESCILSVLAYRNRGLASGIAHPEIIVPSTCHPAFHKAAEYFCVRVITVHPDPLTMRVPLSEVEKSITANTVAIIANAPNFPFGVIDDLAGLSTIALKYNIGLHSDACLGGFIVQFMGMAGFEEKIVDFRHPGVTSISADIHKWGGAPKGASIVMFRSKELRKHSAFAFADYPGGLYVTSGISGSRPGFVIACAWATMLRTGMEGYIENCRTVVQATREIAASVRTVPELRVIGSCETTVVPFTSDTVDIYVVMKMMRERGWLLNPLQFPASVHLGVTMEHAAPGVRERFVNDLREIVAGLAAEVATKGKKNTKHDALIYGSTQGVSDRTIIADVLRKYVDKYYENEPLAASTAA